ncbi:DUF6445 family protein [Phenylobacterium deserti]|uniref:Uncharacterized protein n=1 Tax=Phenylobacterium deserti TaxID=1914756 RepID=A0A328ABQ1_9CAUL|nr:DUF6445 family protein [Phenylobacterium deserti]RAK52162.1 hypothetical protein DJ018_13485 [Phenylobacterium deserti]
MASPTFGLNTRPAFDLQLLGEEREPVLVVDRVLQEPQRLVDYAAETASFDPVIPGRNGYPGVRSPAPLGYVRDVVTALRPAIDQVFGLEGVAAPARAECSLSIVTLPPDQLLPAQRMPHVDTVDPLQFAVLHYLCSDAFDGTAFYRHRSTGFETITPEREAPFHARLDSEVAACPPPPAYVSGDTELFAQTGRVEARFDRLVVYRSRLLHSGQIDPQAQLSPDPRKGRLTANIFLNYRAL